MSGGIDKGVGRRSQEEVAAADLVRHSEGVTRSVKVVGDVEGVDELGDGVGVLVGLLADVSDDVLDLLLLDGAVAGTVAAGDNGGDQVPQDPGARGLDGVDVGGGEEHVQNGLAGLVPVEEGEEGPVHQHSSVVELGTRVVEQLGVDVFPHVLELLHGRLPVGLQNLRGQLAPGRAGNLVVVGREHSELVEHVGGRAVLAASELELTKVIKGVDHLHSNLCNQREKNSSRQLFLLFGLGDLATHPVLVLEKLQVGNLVASQAVDDLILGQEIGNLSRGLLVLLQLRQHILSLLGVLGGSVSHTVEVAVHGSDVVSHIGVLQQLNLSGQNLLGHLVVTLLLRLVALELDQRE